MGTQMMSDNDCQGEGPEFVERATAAEISALKEKLKQMTALLTDALSILESPVYRDSAGARPSIHPRVMDIRDFLENANG
jgi:hypothetical protein